MNKVLIISYDLINPGQNYEQLIKLIKSYPNWARLGDSAYMVCTNATPVQVRDHLRQALDTNDKLFVGVSLPPSAWFGMPEDVSTWIRTNQK